MSWYRGDAERKRGFEPQINPLESEPLWSTSWSGGDKRGSCLNTSSCANKGTWFTNLPRPYRDDLTTDDVPVFSIGTANGRKLVHGRPYFEAFLTNQGQVNSGTVELSGQAVRRAARDEPDNRLYCTGRRRRRKASENPDKFCMFNEVTLDIDRYQLSTSFHSFRRP